MPDWRTAMGLTAILDDEKGWWLLYYREIHLTEIKSCKSWTDWFGRRYKNERKGRLKKLWSQWIYYLGAYQLSHYAFYITPPLFCFSLHHWNSVHRHPVQMKFCMWGSDGGNLPGSLLFSAPPPIPLLPLHLCGEGIKAKQSSQSRDRSAVCLTLPPILDNKINLCSSTLMKVPRHFHLFVLFSLPPLSFYGG